MTTDQTTARGLGYLSLGLGLSQLLAPRWFARTIGIERGDNDTIVRLVGAREILAGTGILMSRNPAPWVWMRVAGDLMDVALLGRAAMTTDHEPTRLNGALASTVGITAVDIMNGLGTSQNGNGNGNGHRQQPFARTTFGERIRETVAGGKPVRKAITIGTDPHALYEYWRRHENLPVFMRHLEDVQETDDRRSHWVATAPFGTRVEWDAEITEDVPGERISWRALPSSTVKHEGTVRFVPAPGDRGTEVHVEMVYDPPAGPIGVAIAKLTGEEPETQVAEDLRRLKQVIETGSVVWSDATRGERKLRQRPAQPLAEPVTESPLSGPTATATTPTTTAPTSSTTFEEAVR
jgi:uncharacterized membrane protein